MKSSKLLTSAVKCLAAFTFFLYTFIFAQPLQAQSYCIPTANSNYESIHKVNINGVTREAFPGYDHYRGTHLITFKGFPNPLAVEMDLGGHPYQEYLKMWVDFNRDGDFDDTDEFIWGQYNYGEPLIHNDLFIPDWVPTTIAPEPYRMRLAMRYAEDVDGPCDDINYGHIVDFDLYVIEEPPLCDAYGNDSSMEWIEKVRIQANEYVSGDNGGFYSHIDYPIWIDWEDTPGSTPRTNISIEVEPGYSQQNYDEHFRIWMDKNSDGDFEDATELLYEGIHNSSFIADITILGWPAYVNRIRVGMSYYDYPDPCGSFTYGEVEDFYLVTFEDDPLIIHDTDLSTEQAPRPSEMVESEEASDDLEIYPNPTSDDIKITHDVVIDFVEVVNLQGRVLMTKQINSKVGQVDVQNLMPGTYILLAHSAEEFSKKNFVIAR